MNEIDENTLGAYIGKNLDTIVLPTPDWNEVIKFKTVMFHDCNGVQMSSGCFLDTRGKREEVVGRIRKLAYEAVRQARYERPERTLQANVCIDPNYLVSGRPTSAKLSIVGGFLATTLLFFSAIAVEIQTVKIPEGTVRTVGNQKFLNPTALVLPQSLVTIGTNAFQSSYGLLSVEMSHAVKRIEAYSFWNCTNLLVTSSLFPEGLYHIGPEAFFACNLDRELILPSTLTELSSTAFCKRRYPDPPSAFASNTYRASTNLLKVVLKGRPPTVSNDENINKALQA